MAGYLLSELGEYMMTKKMTGKEAMSLVMFVTMSQQLVKILKIGMRMTEQEWMSPMFKPRRSMKMTIMMIQMTQLS
jgi:hypothetical protein